MTTLLLILVVLLAFFAINYNKLQKLSQNVKQSASNIQVAISKKLSLINQLIDVVKNYQESEQFTQLKISQDASAANIMASYQQSGATLASLQGFAEKFPNLKASEQYQLLMKNITLCELDIQKNREIYNSQVNRYNSSRSGIPTVFVAQLIGFSEAPYIQFDLSGIHEATDLKSFKTDDGERLSQLLKSAGSNISTAAKTLTHHAGDVGKMLSEKINGKENAPGDFYFLIQGGVPKGPKPLYEIKKMIEEGKISGEIKVAPNGSDAWRDINDYENS